MRKWTTEDRIRAILKVHGAFTDEIEVCEYDDTCFEVGSREYRVLTDLEADQAFDDYYDDLIDEMLDKALPEALRCYFDYDAYKRDIKINEGRGPALASFDSVEDYTTIGGQTFYVYRVA